MEFGKLANIENVRWDLPQIDPLSTARAANSLPQYWIGTPAWGSKEWINRLYPPQTAASRFLSFYAKNFNTIELNTTHYRIPTQEQVERWLKLVPSDFLFCPKVFSGISHEAEGLANTQLIKSWCQSLRFFDGHLGPCFIQFPPHFDYSQKAKLFHFLQQWPDEFQLALEFRHSSWFTEDRHILPALNRYLQTKNIGLVITDVAGRRDLSHASITAPFTMIRFIGNDLHRSDFERLNTWSNRLLEWQERGLTHDVFFFVHEPDDVKAPEMADEVIKVLNANLNAGLTPLQWVTLPGLI